MSADVLRITLFVLSAGLNVQPLGCEEFTTPASVSGEVTEPPRVP